MINAWDGKLFQLVKERFVQHGVDWDEKWIKTLQSKENRNLTGSVISRPHPENCYFFRPGTLYRWISSFLINHETIVEWLQGQKIIFFQCRKSFRAIRKFMRLFEQGNQANICFNFHGKYEISIRILSTIRSICRFWQIIERKDLNLPQIVIFLQLQKTCVKIASWVSQLVFVSYHGDPKKDPRSLSP